jgi:hypothetical protein
MTAPMAASRLGSTVTGRRNGTRRDHLGLILGQPGDHGDGLPGGKLMEYLVFDRVSRRHEER